MYIVSPERREFLKRIDLEFDDTPIKRLRNTLIDNPDKALIHVFPVEDISLEVSY